MAEQLLRKSCLKIYNMEWWGFVDEDQNTVIPFDYDEVCDFEEGLAAVKYRGRWGFVDQAGKRIIPCIYEETSSFQDGLALVSLNRKGGAINKEGNVVIPFLFDYLRFYISNRALIRVRRNNVELSIDRNLNYYALHSYQKINCEFCKCYNDKLTTGLCCRLGVNRDE